MRVVLDTNVLLAAFVAQGTCNDLLEHFQREHHLVTSAFILQEFEDKLKGKFKVPTENASVATSLLRGSAELVTPAPPCARRHGRDVSIASSRETRTFSRLAASMGYRFSYLGISGATKQRHAWIAQMGKSGQYGLDLPK